MIKLQEGQKILFDTINNNLTHIDYMRTIEIAEEFTTYATGLGISKKLKRFNSRETEAEHLQRLQLTITNVIDIFNSCVKPLYKVGRTPANISFEWNKEGMDEGKEVDLRKKILDDGKNFWGKKDVSAYITQRQSDLDSTDPNSFMIVEFEGIVDPAKPETKATPYPFEANSAEAINYVYKNNDLQWLIVKNLNIITDKKGTQFEGSKYYMYLANENITATQIHKDSVAEQINLLGLQIISDLNQILQPTIKQNYLFITNEKTESKRRYFIINVFETKIGFVPAIRVGTIYDTTTRNRTCLPLIFAAQPYFEKSIKAMSEFDLTNCLHTFPQKIVYADPCPGEAYESGYKHCYNGYGVDGKTVCGACKGTGFKGHTSAADVIQIRMPKDIKDIVPLENLIAYKSPPIELLEFQKKFGFYELRELAQSAVYNSDVFTKEQVSQTATGKMIDLDAVYDTLMPYADSWSEIYEHIYRCIAVLKDIGKDLQIVHQFPSDFKMESFDTLLNYLQKANANGAPSYVKKAINKKITHKIYVDEHNEILKIETKDKYFPFAGKTESEINYILANDLTTNYNKIFYANYDLIFNEIEYEQQQKNIDFYLMPEDKQRMLIKEKVDLFILNVQSDLSGATADEFGNIIAEQTGNALKDSIGGLTGMIEIAKAVASGLYDLDAAIALVSDRFGISEEDARRQLGTPSIKGEAAIEKVTALV